MGRRSINTTKSGKYMNPTDQARKEARKRELKKNKKQRQMVRAAVLKGKDPMQILNDMEKIDEMEYSVIAPPSLNEKVLKDKRKKLKETWDRVMRLYSKEDRERFLELRKLEIDYETKRSELMKYFDSVRVTQQVQVDEIPLPSTPNMPSFLTSQIPLPNELDLPSDLYVAPHSILKKTSAYFRREAYPQSTHQPGVPPGPPPDLSGDDDSDDDEEVPMEQETEVLKSSENKSKSRKIRFADENVKLVDDDDSDEEPSTKTSHTQESTEKPSDQPTDVSNESEVDKNIIPNPEDIPVPPLNQVPLPSGPPPRLPQGPPPMMFRPPPLRPGMPPPRLLPPGVPPPPPGRPTLPPPSLPLRLGAPPIRLPPGPPPGIPPLRLIRPPPSIPPPRLPPGVSQTPGQPQSAPSAVLSAPPSLMQRPKNILPTEEETKRAATIEAKPQIRNLSADVMRFMPTTLRVKREDRHKKGSGKAGTTYESSKETYPASAPVSNPSATAPTKDDAYQQFLLEMEEFL